MNQACPTPKPMKIAPGIILQNFSPLDILFIVYAKEIEHKSSGCSSLNCTE